MNVNRYIKTVIKYVLRAFSLLFAVSVIAFTLVKLSPVDPVGQYILGTETVSAEHRAELEEYWGVNEPPVKQFFHWFVALLHGDMGTSILYKMPVLTLIKEKFLNTLALMICAWTFSGIIGFSLGCVMGATKDTLCDRTIKKLCLLLCSIPTFWLGLLLLLVFSVWLGLFPIGFSSPIGVLNQDVSIWQQIYHLFLPALSLSLMSFANVALHTRQKLIDVLESDYVLFAKARGEGRFTILRRHGLRNILLPALTLQFASFAELFGGSVLAENVFSYPGLGSAVSAAGLNSDVPLLLGITLFSALFVFTGNLIANVLYGVIDPKIKEEQD
ncbi:ABC transporter permease [Anaerosporobacter sp.]|uniref:ABC transporter permease n=1 Tax=Anaerosporobacter sp. TaxID=1872529 RepID=UPI00286F9FBB|nr:ABC transporter permease [Anaerosporobacter sp.]